MVITKLYDLPTSIKAFTKKNHDDSYTIMINSRLCREQQEEGYMHEIEHIKKGDFDALDDANDLETIRHGR